MSNYPYRACQVCGTQIHVGGVYICKRCADKADQPADKHALRDAFVTKYWGGFAGPIDCALAVDELIAAALADTERAKDEEIARLNALLDLHEELMHPWYGSCDGFADGHCSECLRVLADRHAAGFREGIEAVAKAFENMPAVAAAIRAIEQSERALQPPENQP